MWSIANNIQDGKFLTNFVKTKWPFYLEEALKNAFTISTGLSKQNILIHCPSGADGSSVMSSLALLILDPEYRTFEGFRTLIFKEWLFFQHNFIKRHALLLEGNNGEHVHGQEISSDMRSSRIQMSSWPNINNCKKYAPYFIFFLDCVHQMI